MSEILPDNLKKYMSEILPDTRLIIQYPAEISGQLTGQYQLRSIPIIIPSKWLFYFLIKNCGYPPLMSSSACRLSSSTTKLPSCNSWARLLSSPTPASLSVKKLPSNTNTSSGSGWVSKLIFSWSKKSYVDVGFTVISSKLCYSVRLRFY